MDIAAYVIGFATGAIIVFVVCNAVFRYRAGRLDVHLRHLIQFAIVAEMKAQEFYLSLERRAADVETARVCRRLAEDETRHRHDLEKKLKRWLPLPADERILVALQDMMDLNGIMVDPPDPGASEKDMVLYAIDQEEKMAGFYRSFEKNFTDAWKRFHLDQLAIEERSHANELKVTYPKYDLGVSS